MRLSFFGEIRGLSPIKILLQLSFATFASSHCTWTSLQIFAYSSFLWCSHYSVWLQIMGWYWWTRNMNLEGSWWFYSFDWWGQNCICVCVCVRALFIPKLVSQVHTPDSSRYWISQSYAERFQSGLEPENVDKVCKFGQISHFSCSALGNYEMLPNIRASIICYIVFFPI